MKVKGLFICLILVCASVTLVKRETGLRLHPSSQPSPRTSHATRLNVQEVYGRLPLSFELNRHPASREMYFVARGRGYNLFLEGSDAIVAVGDGRPNATHVVQMRVLGANSHPHASGISAQRGRSNYLIGSDPRQWRVGIPNFEGILLRDVYRGIDLTYYGKQGDLEYDFVVAPGSDPSVIRLAIDGAERLRLDGHDLLLKVGAGEFRLHAPVVYQMCDGKRMPVSGSFSLTGRNEVGFDIGRYDARRALVIDPGLVYSTYLGGSGQDQVLGISVGKDGSAYVTGSTSSMDFPISATGLQRFLGRSDSTVFVTKLNPTGTAIEYSTYLGGSSSNLGGAIAVAGNGEAYVTGSTYSSDFPVTPTALQRHNSGGMDAFIARLSSDGSHLLYSTYLGGSGDDEAHGLALDQAGNTYITGSSRSQDFLGTGALYPLNRRDCGSRLCQHAFIAKLSATGKTLTYLTFLGSSAESSGTGIAVDLQGTAYVAGDTSARDFPVTNGAFQTRPREDAPCATQRTKQCTDIFVAKLSRQGSVLYSTLVGGSGNQRAKAITIDEIGAAYVTGSTDSQDFPITPGAFQATAPNHSGTALVFKINPLGSKLEYSTLLGGDQEDEGEAIAIDASRHVYVAGTTWSSSFPTTTDAFQIRLNGTSAAFLSRLDEHGSILEYSTILGGSGSDVASALALDAYGNAYVAGGTDSSDFPVRGAVQNAFLGQRNAFVAKFGMDSTTAGAVNYSATTTAAPVVTLSPTSLQFLNQKPGTTSTGQTVKLTNSGSAALTNVVVALSGVDAKDFTVTTTPVTNCGGSLAIGASCTLTVTFKPSAVGVRVAIVNITDNASNSPQTVQLTGNPPIASVSAKSLTFASQAEGRLSAYQTLTLKNTAAYTSLRVNGISLSTAANFQQANNCPGILSANASCSITVAFMPRVTGTLTANVNFSDNSLNNSESTQSVALSGTATSAPVASLSATSINFGTLQQGTKSGVKTVTLTNTGVGTLTISNVYLTAADSFILSTGSGSCSGTASLQSGASCTISVTFYANAGVQTSTVLITNNSGNLSGTVQEISLAGAGTIGTYNGQFSALQVDFGSVQMGSTGVQKVVQFRNTGTLPLSLGANSLFTSDYYDYQVQPASSNGCGAIALAVGASCNISIIFKPALGSPGPRSGTASITIAAPYFTQAIYLTGMATGQASPTLSTTGLTFGTVNVGSTSVTKTIVLKNTGNEPLTTGGLSISGTDFAVVSLSTNNCSPTGGTNLLPGASCNIGVAFQPKSAGTLSELLTLFTTTGNGGGGTQLYIALTGIGQSTTSGPIVTMSANTLQFGNQQAGTISGVQSITMTNTGTIPWYIVASSPSSNFIMESPCNNYVNPGGSCVVSVYFAPTTLGSQPSSASLQFSTATTNSNLMLVFTGTGTGNLAAKVSSANLNLGTATSGSLGGSGAVTFTNTGNVPYPFGNVGVNELNPVGTGSPLDFQQTNNCQFGGSGMMPVGASCTVLVTFTPAIGPSGPREAFLTFQEGSIGTSLLQQNVTLTGTATGTPVMSVSPLSFTFLDQTQGTSSSALALTISNTGTAPLPFNVSSGGGEFPFLSYDCPAILQQGTSCVVYFTFNPTPNPSFGPRFSSAIVGATGGFLTQQLIPLSGFGTP